MRTERKTPHIDKLLADAEAALARQSNPAAIEHIIVSMLRKAKENPRLAQQLEQICPEAHEKAPRPANEPRRFAH